MEQNDIEISQPYLFKQSFVEKLFKEYGITKQPHNKAIINKIASGLINQHKKGGKARNRYVAFCCMTVNESTFELRQNHTHTIPLTEIFYLHKRYPEEVKQILGDLISEKGDQIMPSINKRHNLNSFWMRIIFNGQNRDLKKQDEHFEGWSKLISKCEISYRKISHGNSNISKKTIAKTEPKNPVKGQKKIYGPNPDGGLNIHDWWENSIVAYDSDDEMPSN